VVRAAAAQLCKVAEFKLVLVALALSVKEIPVLMEKQTTPTTEKAVEAAAQVLRVS
jgi:hypothetical protein